MWIPRRLQGVLGGILKPCWPPSDTPTRHQYVLSGDRFVEDASKSPKAWPTRRLRPATEVNSVVSAGVVLNSGRSLVQSPKQ